MDRWLPCAARGTNYGVLCRSLAGSFSRSCDNLRQRRLRAPGRAAHLFPASRILLSWNVPQCLYPGRYSFHSSAMRVRCSSASEHYCLALLSIVSLLGFLPFELFVLRSHDPANSWTRGYSQATAIRSNGWIASTNCVSTAAGPRTLTSVWPASWVSAAEDFASVSTWPIIPPSGIIQPSVVINDPTVMAEGISIMWESTDTQIQSWFNHYGGSGSPKTTESVPTHLTTAAPSPTQSVTTPTATNVQSSRAWERGRGNKLYMAVLGAALLVCTSLTL